MARSTRELGGFFLGWLRYLIAGWWYRVRVNWSGDWAAHSEYARVVFVHVELIWAIPVIAIAIYESFVYASPSVAFASSSLRIISLPAFLISYYYSWVAVTESFDVSATKAAAWFLVLPAFVTCSAFIIATITVIMNIATLAPK